LIPIGRICGFREDQDESRQEEVDEAVFFGLTVRVFPFPISYMMLSPVCHYHGEGRAVPLCRERSIPLEISDSTILLSLFYDLF
jgi:hypothetical protein